MSAKTLKAPPISSQAMFYWEKWEKELKVRSTGWGGSVAVKRVDGELESKREKKDKILYNNGTALITSIATFHLKKYYKEA